MHARTHTHVEAQVCLSMHACPRMPAHTHTITQHLHTHTPGHVRVVLNADVGGGCAALLALQKYSTDQAGLQTDLL